MRNGRAARLGPERLHHHRTPRTEYAHTRRRLRQRGHWPRRFWVFDATDLGTSLGGTEETIITVFGDKPRALAVSNDGSTVNATIFHAGNPTAALNAGYMCETSQSNLDNDIVQSSCSIAGTTAPGGPCVFSNLFCDSLAPE